MEHKLLRRQLRTGKGQLSKRFRSLPLVRRFLRGRVNTPIRQPTAGSDLVWEALPPGPSPRFDAGVVQIGHLMYCVGGYVSEDHVLSVIDVFDLAACQWVDRIPLPPGMPQSHLAMAQEADRYIYSAGGQLGPHCRPPIANAFVLDTLNRTWHSLPALPESRYALTMQLWSGRLHVMGGARADRYTPASEHWSLGVKDGAATESEWRVEVPLPRGGGHRASAVVQDRLYIFGGQEGDFIAVPGHPDFACTGETVTYVHGDIYRLDRGADHWERLHDMPVTSSHTEFSIVVHDNLVIIAGGTRYKDPKTFEIELTDAVQVFDTRTGTWEIRGRVPLRVATCLTALHDGWLYTATGISDRGSEDASPTTVESGGWRAKIVW